jgi:DNA-binding NarL/FixJ family response regulator
MTVPNKKITIEDEKIILELYKKGKSGPEILKELNFKFKTVKTIYDCIKT